MRERVAGQQRMAAVWKQRGRPLLAGALALLLPLRASAVQAAPGTADEGADERVAGVGTEDDLFDFIAPAASAGVPLHAPGQHPGTREPVRTRPIAPPAPPESREWFGARPWWEWSRMTGDWAGGRTWLEEHGITIESSFTIEWANAISGGTASKWVSRNYFDLNATLDTAKLGAWEGGVFYIDVASSNSPDGGVFVPGLLWTSNIEIDGDTFQIANCWYEQTLFDGALRAKFGKIDATLEFGYLGAADGFLNLAALYPATFLTVPTYPYAGLGGVLFLYPSDHFYVGAGVFDAGDEVDSFVRNDSFDDVWLVGEAGITWDELGSLHDGRVACGGWWDSQQFERFDGSGEDTAFGLYALVEQRLIAPDDRDRDDPEDDRGLWVFGQWAYADPDVSEAQIQYGAGLALQGTFPGRDLDRVGIYAANLVYSSSSSPAVDASETAVELFYRLAITPAVALTPDIQFQFNPSGDSTLKDPIVLTLRLEMSF